MNTLKTVWAVSAMAFALGAPVPAAAMDPFIGQIQYFGFSFTPRGWAPCNGQLLPVSSNTALFSLLGTTYGGDGRTTFGLPDARGRVLVGQGRGPGLPDFRIGSKGGTTSNTLTVNQLPSHTHSAALHASGTAGNTGTPAANTVLAGVDRGSNYSSTAPNVTMSPTSVTIGSAGGGQPVNNLPPYLTVNCQIALVGIFPSRN